MALTLLSLLKREYGPGLGRRMYAQMWRPGMAKLAPLTRAAQLRHGWGQMTGGGGRVPPDPKTRPPGLDEATTRREERNYERRERSLKIGSEADVTRTAKWREDRRQGNLWASRDRWGKHQAGAIEGTIGEGASFKDVAVRVVGADGDDLKEKSESRVEPIAPGTELAGGKTDADRKAANKRLREMEISKRNQLFALAEPPDKVVKTNIDLPGGRPRQGAWVNRGIGPVDPLDPQPAKPQFVEAEKLHVRVPKGYSDEYANKFAARELLKEKRKERNRARARDEKVARAKRMYYRGRRRHPFAGRWLRRRRRRFNV